MAAEIPISLAKFHSFPYVTADLCVIPWLSISQLRLIFFPLQSAEKYSRTDKLLFFYSEKSEEQNKTKTERKN